MGAILTEIISILTSGLVDFGTAIGTALSSMVQSIFVTTGEGGAMALSTFGGLVVVFAGIGLAVSFSRLLVRWVSSLGGSRI